VVNAVHVGWREHGNRIPGGSNLLLFCIPDDKTLTGFRQATCQRFVIRNSGQWNEHITEEE